LAAGFVIWLTSAVGSVFALRKAREHARGSRWALAGLCLVAAGIAGVAAIRTSPDSEALAQGPGSSLSVFTPTEPVNSPMGTAFGVKPGRVVWAHDPKATTWDGTSNEPGWWDDRATRPDIVERMLAHTIRSVGDAPGVQEAWERIFKDFNRRKGKGEVGYKKGERIAVKLNLNQCRSHGDCGNASYIAPQLVVALVRQLVREVGAAPGDITCYDAVRWVPSTIYDRCTAEFPGIRFVDSVGGDGRDKAAAAPTDTLTLAGGEVIYLPTCVTEAEYLVNVAGLKGHGIAGITVCAKNHLGSMLTAGGDSAARQIHRYIGVRAGSRGGGAALPMGTYNGLVDLSGHRHIGGKTILYLIDALYATRHNEYRLDPSCQWQSPPFNGRWTASLFASQDGVALDSVALDFLRNELTLSSIVTGSVDNYLHESAQAHEPPSKKAYDPEGDGRPVTQSLGVHEHWNNARDRKYTRNVGTGPGIELVSLPAGS